MCSQGHQGYRQVPRDAPRHLRGRSNPAARPAATPRSQRTKNRPPDAGAVAGAVKDRVDGLGLGADDYLSKPFDFAELVARVRALGRRASPPLPPIIERADISLDTARRVALRAGRRLSLGPKEFSMLECLLLAEGRAVSSEQLLEQVWDEFADPFTSTVKVTLSRLRAKLGDPPIIETAREGGYRIG